MRTLSADLKRFRKIVSKGKDATWPEKKKLFLKKRLKWNRERITELGTDLFREAVYFGDVEILESIIKCFNLKVDALNNGWSLLNFACKTDGDVLLRVLDLGVKDCTDQVGKNAMCAAATSARPVEIFEVLTKRGFSPISDDGLSALEIAVLFKRSVAARILVEYGSPIPEIKGFVPFEQTFRIAGWKQKEEDPEFEKPVVVHSLKNICRNTIRRSLNGSNIYSTSKRLPVPSSLQEFVLRGNTEMEEDL